MKASEPKAHLKGGYSAHAAALAKVRAIESHPPIPFYHFFCPVWASAESNHHSGIGALPWAFLLLDRRSKLATAQRHQDGLRGLYALHDLARAGDGVESLRGAFDPILWSKREPQLEPDVRESRPPERCQCFFLDIVRVVSARNLEKTEGTHKDVLQSE